MKHKWNLLRKNCCSHFKVVVDTGMDAHVKWGKIVTAKHGVQS